MIIIFLSHLHVFEIWLHFTFAYIHCHWRKTLETLTIVVIRNTYTPYQERRQFYYCLIIHFLFIFHCWILPCYYIYIYKCTLNIRNEPLSFVNSWLLFATHWPWSEYFLSLCTWVISQHQLETIYNVHSGLQACICLKMHTHINCCLTLESFRFYDWAWMSISTFDTILRASLIDSSIK